MDENRLSSSLLYCLDGNRPEHSDNNDENDETTTETNELHNHDNDYEKENNMIPIKTTPTDDIGDVTTTASSSTHLPLTTTNRLANNPFVILNNARKRAATNDIEKMSSILFNSQHSPYQGFKTVTHNKTTKFVNNVKSSSNSNSNASSSSSSSSSSNIINKFSNKENFEHNENYITNKKLIIGEYTGETSF